MICELYNNIVSVGGMIPTGKKWLVNKMIYSDVSKT